MAPKAAQNESADPSAAENGQAEQIARFRRVSNWVATHRIHVAILGLVCLISCVGLFVASQLLLSGTIAGSEITLEAGFDSLDRGDYAKANEIATELQKKPGLSIDELSGAAYIRGFVSDWEAEQAWTQNPKKSHLLAAYQLEEARDRGFPKDREAIGLHLLGKNLYLSGQTSASQPILLEALKSPKAQKTPIHRLLAAAYLEDANPDYAKALQYNTAYLSDASLPVKERYQGLLQRSEIFLQQSAISECRATLAEIPERSATHPDALVITGHLLIHEARALAKAANKPTDADAQALEKYQQAVKLLRQTESHDSLTNPIGSKVEYLIGICLLESGDARGAWSQLDRLRRVYAETPEALAADFALAELARSLGRDDEALAAYRRVLSLIEDPKIYSNQWLPLDELRRRLLDAYQEYLDSGDYDRSLALVLLFPPTFPSIRALEMLAETHRISGRNLLGSAADLPSKKSEPLFKQGREHLRRAGRAYGRLAQVRLTTNHYPDDLWASAESYFEGHAYRETVETLRIYFRRESQRRHPRALVLLGEALLTLGRYDEALEEFRRCVEFHSRDAASFRARLLIAQTHIEKGEPDLAEASLRKNLEGDTITPSSAEWRGSLFALGRLLYSRDRYLEAVVAFEEAIARYPDVPEAIAARYFMSDAYWKSARIEADKLESILVETVRIERAKIVRELLGAARVGYEQTLVAVRQHQATRELTPPQQSMMRNSHFALGGVFFDLGDYDAAVKAYMTAAKRYQTSPEVLDAYVQIARAYRSQGNPQAARGALAQAKIVLKRMDPSKDLAGTTNYTMQQWSDRLDWLDSL